MRLSFKFFFLVFLCFLFFFATASFAFAEPLIPDAKMNNIFHLKVFLFDNSKIYTCIHEFDESVESRFVLFLPSNCDRNHLLVTFDEEWFVVDDVELNKGERTDVFSKDGSVIISVPNGTYALSIVSSSNLPSIFITTESGNLANIHENKSNKEKGAFSLVDDGKIICHSLDLDYIKGRGNSSWKSNEKRSYTIKFKEKTGLLGMAQSKKWVLTSNNMDASLMRNAISYTIAQHLSIPYTIQFRFIDLYINGNYRGNYLLCEKVAVEKNRIQIQDLDKQNKIANPKTDFNNLEILNSVIRDEKKRWCDIPNNPTNISGGYLLEIDYPDEYDSHSGAFITSGGFCLVLHSPERPTKAEIDYISSFYNEFEEAAFSNNGYNKKGKSFLDYIDIGSFVDGVLLYEFTANQDKGLSSFYFYLPDDSTKFVMGPAWDFDQSMETPTQTLECAFSIAKRQLGLIKKNQHRFPISFIDLLCSHASFIDKLQERFYDFSRIVGDLENRILVLNNSINKSAVMDGVRWNYQINEKNDIDLLNYTALRLESMNNEFFSFNSVVKGAKKNLVDSLKLQWKFNCFLVIVIVLLFVIASVISICFAKTKKDKKRKKV